MQLSGFAKQLSGDSSIVDLMEDLGDALNVNPDMLFLGGGNPAQIPKFEALMGRHLSEVVSDADSLHRLLGVYQSPQGSESLIANLVQYFRKLSWSVDASNICITNGSQSAFFMLSNLFAGDLGGGMHKRICLPMLPEYLGYADQGVASNMFYGQAPIINSLGEHEFKYGIDFERLVVDEGTAALCVSRPTNPTGNVANKDEIAQLESLAEAQGIALIIDCAYGQPFPGIVYDDEATLEWTENRVFVLSLSKLGLPGARTGIVVGPSELIKRLVKMNTILSLANGNLGPVLMNSLLENDELDSSCRTIIRPFYEEKRHIALALVAQYFKGISYRVHKAEGAFFLWLNFPGLPITSRELYQRLKLRKVLVMDGSPFFFGLHESWDHARECIRVSYCQSPDVLERAMEIIANEIRGLS
ncbi:MAG: valine--pyruvate aminotransferase [Flavobacteriales bacterium]|jgi:valine--pyruvate aminotransferase